MTMISRELPRQEQALDVPQNTEYINICHHVHNNQFKYSWIYRNIGFKLLLILEVIAFVLYIWCYAFFKLANVLLSICHLTTKAC